MKKWEANYTPLTPITFLQRAAMSYADRNSIIYGGARFTWRQTYDRCRRLASSLRSLGVAKNDVVSFAYFTYQNNELTLNFCNIRVLPLYNNCNLPNDTFSKKFE